MEQDNIFDEQQKFEQKGKNSTPSFLIKTYEILENANYENIISWSQDGVAFVIKNVQELAEKVIYSKPLLLFFHQVLPNHFKHNNYASFVRQLNMYDFHKIKNENGQNEFRHKYFQRGNKNLLQNIKRKQSEANDQQEEKQISGQNCLCQFKKNIYLQKLPILTKLISTNQRAIIHFFLMKCSVSRGNNLSFRRQQRLQLLKMIIQLTKINYYGRQFQFFFLIFVQEIKKIKENDERKIEALSFLLASLIKNLGQSSIQMPQQTGQIQQIQQQQRNEKNNDILKRNTGEREQKNEKFESNYQNNSSRQDMSSFEPILLKKQMMPPQQQQNFNGNNQGDLNTILQQMLQGSSTQTGNNNNNFPFQAQQQSAQMPIQQQLLKQVLNQQQLQQSQQMQTFNLSQMQSQMFVGNPQLASLQNSFPQQQLMGAEKKLEQNVNATGILKSLELLQQLQSQQQQQQTNLFQQFFNNNNSSQQPNHLIPQQMNFQQSTGFPMDILNLQQQLQSLAQKNRNETPKKEI